MAIRVGFVGCGGMNGTHMKNIAANPDAEVAAVCDIDEARAGAAAGEYGVKAFTDYAAMITSSELDAVYVAVPPFAHEGQEIAAVEAGCHLFVEKPVALSMEYANRVAEACDDAGVISTAGFQDRYLDVLDVMKGVVSGNKPGLMMGYWMGGIPGVWWWRVKEKSGGQAAEQTIHIFDSARYLFGEVESVHAVSSRGLVTDMENYDVEDASAVNLQFSSGLCGTVFSSCFAAANNRSGIDAWCRDVSLSYTERRSLRIMDGNGDERLMTVKVDPVIEIDNAFVEAILSKDQSLLRSSYADAARSLAVVLAANESMASGEAVKL